MVIIICIIVIWYIIHNAKRATRFTADKTARLFVDKFFVYRRAGWTYTRDSVISNEDMQAIIEEIKIVGSKL